MAEDRKCAHPGCIGWQTRGSDYCSTQCQRANGSEREHCDCPHEMCREQQELSDEGLPDGSDDPCDERRRQAKAAHERLGQERQALAITIPPGEIKAS